MPRTLKLLLLACALAAPLAAAQETGRQPAAPAAPAADAEVERAKQALGSGDAKSAVALLKPVAERHKTDADAWYYYGVALGRAGRNKDARKALEKAVKLKPDSASAHTWLALVLLSLNKPRDAASEAGRAVSLDPANADAHYAAAAVRLREDNYDESLGEAEAALRLRPDFPAAGSLAAEALLNVYVRETERAADRYPLPAGADEESRKPVFAQRDALVAPVRERMRALSARLADFAAARPDNPAAAGWRETAETLRVYGGEWQGAGIYRQAEVTTKALITYKPEPAFTEVARQNNVTGVVRLRAVLAADGRVRNILVIKGLPDGLTQQSVAAARQIRFTPATVNGRPVSQFVVLEYNFNVY